MTNKPTNTPANGTTNAATNGTAKASERPKDPMPIRVDDRLPACPFCGTHLNEVVSIPFDASRNSRAIMCTKCGAQGPTRWPPTNTNPLDLAEARAAWTARAQKK